MRTIAVLLLIATGAFAQYQAPPMYYRYNEGCAESLRTGKPLLVFVGHVPRVSADGVVHATVNTLGKDYPAQCVVLSVPDSGVNIWKTTLPMTVNRAEIAKAVKPSTVPFDPFSSHNRRYQQTTAQPDGRKDTGGLQYNASHRCPNCGIAQTTVSGIGPSGTHTHHCTRCGQGWYH